MRATLLIFLGILASAQTKMPEPAKIKIDFEKHVQPILAQKCYACHGEEVQQSGLRLDKRQNALRGGDYGPVIMPGKSTESKSAMMPTTTASRPQAKARVSDAIEYSGGTGCYRGVPGRPSKHGASTGTIEV